MGNTLDELVVSVNPDQLEMNHRIHPLLDELGIEIVVWAIAECLEREKCGQESQPLNAPKPIADKVIPEEHVVKLLRFALEFPEEERAERLANIITAIFEGDEHHRVYRPVFLDYLTYNRNR